VCKCRLTKMKNGLTHLANWMYSNYVRPPAFNQQGGEVAASFIVTLQAGAGAIYFTTDGSDPRAAGGAVASSAQRYTGSFPLGNSTVVKARVRSGTEWSGLALAEFMTPQDLAGL